LKRIIPAIIVVIIGIFIAYYMLIQPKPLKIYNPSDINPKLVDESVQDVSKNHRVGSFNLVDQEGNTITELNFKN